MIRVNDVIGQRYKIISELGKGGMSDVYEARDVIFRREVALKIIKYENAKRIDNLIRFQNEARFSAAFNHPNIVKIYDYGEYNNLPYIVTEYVKGQTLRDVLDYKRCFSLNESCSIMLQLCEALIEVHSKNIVHRDIKPQNVYYASDGEIKLGDFGISVLLGSGMNVNENKKVMGTAQYLAPELVYGEKATFQSDIYAMGITFFELLTGRVPFDGKNPHDVAVMQVEKEVPSPLTINPDLPKEVEYIIFKAVNKNLDERYKSVNEMKKDILSLYKNKKIMRKRGSLFARIFGRN
mgnify:FL=1